MECGQGFSESQVIRIGQDTVCGGCKDIYLQKIREGQNVGAELSALPIASGWKRVRGYIVNWVLNVGWGIFLSFLVSGIFGPEALDGEEINLGASLTMLVGGYVIPGIVVFYFMITKGGTPGHLAVGTRIVTADGRPLSTGRAVGRVFAGFLSSLILGIGYLIAFFDDEKRTLHDRICNTRVIDAK